MKVNVRAGTVRVKSFNIKLQCFKYSHGPEVRQVNRMENLSSNRIESGLNERFAFRVQSRRCFVQEKDFRIADQGTSDGDALLLAATQLRPALTDHRFVFLQGTERANE